MATVSERVRTPASRNRRELVRRVARRARELVRRRDLGLTSAGAALYGSLAVVPSLLVAVAGAKVVLGEDRLRGFVDRLAGAVPDEQRADDAVRQLLEAGESLPWPAVVLAVVMASAYGIGLQHAMRRVAPPTERERPPAWWLRVLTLPLLGLAPLTLVGLLAAAPLLADLSRSGDAGPTALAVYVSLNLVWVLTWAPLTWTFRIVGPGQPSWRSAIIGALVTGAFVSGFLQGFLLFLRLPVDLGRPFGGLEVVGLVSGLLLWMWLVHVVVLVGYALTWAIDDETGAADGVSDDPPNQEEVSGTVFR